jgi:hypothetical protein
MTMMLDRNPSLPPAPATADADRGQAAFTRTGLALYDLLVLRGLCPWIWRCPNKRILAAYREHLSNNHLEVGVGTGYFLDHARFSNAAPRVALLDLNTHCLARTARRVARYHPEIYRADVLQPIVLDVRRFDSIALNAGPALSPADRSPASNRRAAEHRGICCASALDRGPSIWRWSSKVPSCASWSGAGRCGACRYRCFWRREVTRMKW